MTKEPCGTSAVSDAEEARAPRASTVRPGRCIERRPPRYSGHSAGQPSMMFNHRRLV